MAQKRIHFPLTTAQQRRLLFETWEATGDMRRFSFVAGGAAQLLGYPPERWLEEDDFWERIVHEEDRVRMAALRRRALTKGKDYTAELRAIRADGRVIWIDEAFTPDSSRYWDARAWNPGRTPVSFDKQFVRDWLDSTGWDHRPPAPRLPEGVVRTTREKYLEAYRSLTDLLPTHLSD